MCTFLSTSEEGSVTLCPRHIPASLSALLSGQYTAAGASGLGLEAQHAAVREYLNGGEWGLVAELTEVESGKRSDRPKLAEALKLPRLTGATLIIAKLDRLAATWPSWRRSWIAGVDFVAVDFPERQQPHDPHSGRRGAA